MPIIYVEDNEQLNKNKDTRLVMRTYFDCIPCFVRQVLDSARLATDDEQIREQIIREVLVWK